MPISRVILILFAFTAATNIVAAGTGNDSLFWATKPLLMPLLAAMVIFGGGASRAPGRTLVAGLSFATVGDVFLMIDGDPWFYAGMGAFAACHACYITAFVRAGSWRRLRRPPLVLIPLLYAVVVVAAEIVLRLPIPIVAYGCLLAVMAASAAGLGWRAGVGGALFLLSDLLIGLDLSGVDVPGPPIWVMLTYALGQVLIALGWQSKTGVVPPTPIPHQPSGAETAVTGTASDEQVTTPA
jgi:uncharacterized membrane protein YhhN